MQSTSAQPPPPDLVEVQRQGAPLYTGMGTPHVQQANPWLHTPGLKPCMRDPAHWQRPCPGSLHITHAFMNG